RSVPEVLRTANALMRGRPGALELHPPAGRADASPPTSLTAYPDERAEAQGVAASVAAQLASGTAPREVAVLYRSHAQSAELVQAFADAG
ncbi:hypothetical protein ABLW43_23260, partial [Salmonella enterica]